MPASRHFFFFYQIVENRALQHSAAVRNAKRMELSGGLFWLIVVIILITLGVLGYFIYDYLTYKADVADTLKRDRETDLAHDKYIIDKANEVAGTLNAGLATTTSTAAYARAGLSNVTDVLGATFRFSSNVGGVGAGATAGAAGGFKLGEVPGALIGSVALMKHTSFIGGLTAHELSPATAATLCGTGANAERCVRFPDADGNTYLTGLTPEASVVLGAAKTKVLGSLDFGEIGAIGNQEGSLHIGGPAVSLGNYYAPNGMQSAEINVFGLNNDEGMYYASKKADEALDPNAIVKLMTTRDGGLIINGKGIVLMSNSEPYAVIGYDAKNKGVVVAAGPGGKVIVQGDVVMADKENVFATLAREYGKDGAANGLRVTSVAANRLVLDTDVYLGDGRTLYGKTEGAAGAAVGGGAIQAPTPEPTRIPVPAIIMDYYAILEEVRSTLLQNSAAFVALISLPEEIFNYQKDPTGFFTKYPFMESVMKLVTYKNTAEFTAFSEADVAATETAIGYFTNPAFSVELPNGRYHIGAILQGSINQFYLNNRDVLNARYGYPLIGR